MKLHKIDKAVAIVVVALVALLLVTPALSAIIASISFPSSGNIAVQGNIAVLQTSTGPALTNINWNSVNPGTSQTYTIYIQNTGNTPLILGMSYSNIIPAGSVSYIWNKEGYVLPVGATTDAIITLQVALAAPSGAFSGTITISGSQ